MKKLFISADIEGTAGIGQCRTSTIISPTR